MNLSYMLIFFLYFVMDINIGSDSSEFCNTFVKTNPLLINEYAITCFSHHFVHSFSLFVLMDYYTTYKNLALINVINLSTWAFLSSCPSTW